MPRQCPECKNKGWKPDDKFKEPLRNYGKDKLNKISIRYIVCLNCGYRFKTIEKFYEEVESAPGLFDDEDKR